MKRKNLSIIFETHHQGKRRKKKSFFIINVASKTFERPGGNPKLSESAYFNREKYIALLFPSRFFYYYY